MATLQGALDELVTVLDAVTGVNYVPPDPPNSIPTGPTAVPYASGGSFGSETFGTYKGMHNPVIALVLPQGVSLSIANQVMLPLLEPTIDALYGHRNGVTSSHYSTFTEINYTYGPIEWPPDGRLLVGFLFTIRGLKIINTVS